MQNVLQPNDLLLTQGAGNVGAISVELGTTSTVFKIIDLVLFKLGFK